MKEVTLHLPLDYCKTIMFSLGKQPAEISRDVMNVIDAQVSAALVETQDADPKGRKPKGS